MAKLDLVIRTCDFADARVIALLHTHYAVASAQTASGSAHALDVAGLQSSEISLWTIWGNEDLAGCGALKRHSPDHGEVKSMHTIEKLRGTGVGKAMLRHLIEQARGQGINRLSLQTSTWAFFKPAIALYRSHGFVECAPFSTYVEDPNSVFLTLDMRTVRARQS